MARRGSRRRGTDHGGEHADERWLLTYSDLITLLMALFMVLFSISSVNKSKFESLQHSLQEAFSGRILPAGQSIKESGSNDRSRRAADTSVNDATLEEYLQSVSTSTKGASARRSPAQQRALAASASRAEQQSFEALKRRIDALVAAKGLTGRVQTDIDRRGLVIRLLTDRLLFDSGRAVPRPASQDLLARLGRLLAGVPHHDLLVEGHTDDVPIHSGMFPTNWELSTARAASVVRAFGRAGFPPARMTAAGRAATQPAAPNDSAAGRSLNRRVEVLVPRAAPAPTGASSTPSILSQAP